MFGGGAAPASAGIGGVPARGLELPAGAMGGYLGGSISRMVPLHGYASGGPIVSGPHVALIGEGRHNEAIVPLPDGRSIPVDMGGSGGAEINISIEAVDASGIDELLIRRQDTLRSIIAQAMTESRSFRQTMRGAASA